MATAPAKDGRIGPDKWAMARIAVACLLVVMGTVSKATIGGVEFTGGATLIALAALLLLWPLVRAMAQRGGSAKLAGLEVKVDSLERRTEGEYSPIIAELNTKIEELRTQVMQMKEGAGHAEAATCPLATFDDSAFREAVHAYKAHRKVSDWRARVRVDKRLLEGAGRIPTSMLESLLAESPGDQETQMAVAVSLRIPYPREDDSGRGRILTDLLQSRFERVRHRAARSIQRLAKRVDTTGPTRRALLAGIERAIQVERAPVVRRAMRQARSALTAAMAQNGR